LGSGQLLVSLLAQVDVFFGGLLGFLLEAVEHKYRVAPVGHVEDPKGAVVFPNADFHDTRANAWHWAEIVRLASSLNFVYLKPRLSLGVQREIAQPILRVSNECNRFLARHAGSLTAINLYQFRYNKLINRMLQAASTVAVSPIRGR